MIILPKGKFLGEIKVLRHRADVLGSITSYPSHRYSTTRHVHEIAHISMVLTGGNLEKRQTGNIERTAGSVTFCDAGEPHQITNILSGSVHVNLGITREFLQKFGIREIRPDPHGFHDQSLTMLKICRSLTSDDPDAMISLESDLLRLLTSKVLAKARPRWLAPVEEMLRDRWNENVSLAEMASVAGAHPVTLSSAFPEYIGCTIGEYRRKLRIERAVTLIRKRQMSLSEISYECGFTDQSHFIRSMKSMISWSPKRLRTFLDEAGLD